MQELKEEKDEVEKTINSIADEIAGRPHTDMQHDVSRNFRCQLKRHNFADIQPTACMSASCTAPGAGTHYFGLDFFSSVLCPMDSRVAWTYLQRIWGSSWTRR